MIIIDDSPSTDYDSPAECAADILSRGVALTFALVAFFVVLFACFPAG